MLHGGQQVGQVSARLRQLTALALVLRAQFLLLLSQSAHLELQLRIPVRRLLPYGEGRCHTQRTEETRSAADREDMQGRWTQDYYIRYLTIRWMDGVTHGR